MMASHSRAEAWRRRERTRQAWCATQSAAVSEERLMPRWSMGCLHPRTKQRWQLNTGAKCDEDRWIDDQRRRQRMEQATETIVGTLGKLFADTNGERGADLRRPDKDGTLWMIDPVEPVCRAMQRVKHVVFLPSVAHAERSALIRDFEHYAIGKHVRYFVLTGGARCHWWELNAKFKYLQTHISEFFQEMKVSTFKHILPLLRVNEFTLLREADGELSFHPHINLAVQWDRALSKERYKEFMALMRAHFGTHLEDNGQVVNAREVVKYFCKFESTDDDKREDGRRTLGLLDVKPDELDTIYRLRGGMKPVQCLGPFKRHRRALRHARMKTVRKMIGGKMHLTVDPMNPKREKRAGVSTETTNVLVCVTDPQSALLPITRPIIIVKNFTGDFDGLRHKYPQLATLRQTVMQWETERAEYELAASEAKAALEVHNLTETHGGNSDFSGWDDPGGGTCERAPWEMEAVP